MPLAVRGPDGRLGRLLQVQRQPHPDRRGPRRALSQARGPDRPQRRAHRHRRRRDQGQPRQRPDAPHARRIHRHR